MISAVLIFGLMNVVFEFILLSMLRPRTRLRILGNEIACVYLHFVCLSLNLLIHWGTLIGTMSGIFSFICSIFTVVVARAVFGVIKEDRYYTRGLVGYAREELV